MYLHRWVLSSQFVRRYADAFNVSLNLIIWDCWLPFYSYKCNHLSYLHKSIHINKICTKEFSLSVSKMSIYFHSLCFLNLIVFLRRGTKIIHTHWLTNVHMLGCEPCRTPAVKWIYIAAAHISARVHLFILMYVPAYSLCLTEYVGQSDAQRVGLRGTRDFWCKDVLRLHSKCAHLFVCMQF